MLISFFSSFFRLSLALFLPFLYLFPFSFSILLSLFPPFFPRLFIPFCLLLFIYFLLHLLLSVMFLVSVSVLSALLSLYLPFPMYYAPSSYPLFAPKLQWCPIDCGSCCSACEERRPSRISLQPVLYGKQRRDETPWLADRGVTIRLVPALQLATAHLHKACLEGSTAWTADATRRFSGSFGSIRVVTAPGQGTDRRSSVSEAFLVTYHFTHSIKWTHNIRDLIFS